MNQHYLGTHIQSHLLQIKYMLIRLIQLHLIMNVMTQWIIQKPEDNDEN